MNAIKITTKDENGQNKLHLEITQVVLPIMNINTIQEFCTHIFQINHLVN